MTLSPDPTDRMYLRDERQLSDSSYKTHFGAPSVKSHIGGNARAVTSGAARSTRQTAENTSEVDKIVLSSGAMAINKAASTPCAGRGEAAPAPKVDDHAGVAEALLKLQQKLSLLSHERALAERDLNALTDELSLGRSRPSRQRIGQRMQSSDNKQIGGNYRTAHYHRPDDTVAESSRRLQRSLERADGRTPLCDASDDELTSKGQSAPPDPVAATDLPEVNSNENGRRRLSHRFHVDARLAAAMAEEDDQTMKPREADVINAHADLSAAEARCLQLDARLALMRRALHTATSQGDLPATTLNDGVQRRGADFDCAAPIPLRKPSSAAGAAVSSTKTILRSDPLLSTYALNKQATRCLMSKRSALASRAAGTAVAARSEQGKDETTASRSSPAMHRPGRGRRGPTAPTLSRAAIAIRQRSLEGCLAHRAATCSGIPEVRATLPNQQELCNNEATTVDTSFVDTCSSRLRRLREEFTRLNREHRHLTLLVGDAIASGRPSVDLERELDHLAERMEVKGDQIAQCVRTLTEDCPTSGVNVACTNDTCQTVRRSSKLASVKSAASASDATEARSTGGPSSSRRRRARSVATAKSKVSRSGHSKAVWSGSSISKRSNKAGYVRSKVVLLCKSRKPGDVGSYSAAVQLRRTNRDGRLDNDRAQHRVSWA